MSPYAIEGLAVIALACWLFGGKQMVKAFVVTMVFGLALAAVFAML